MAKANQTFFIPENIRRLQFSGLPQSPELASVLRRLRASTLDDLCGTSLRDFQRVSDNGTALFLEVGRLIERARRGDFTISPVGNERLNSVSSRRLPPLSSIPKEKGQAGRRSVSEAPTDETIFIPAEAHGKLLATFPISARLQHIFESKHFRLFGDLHGRSFSEIRSYCNCGKKTIEELRNLVREIQHSHQQWVEDGRAEVAVHEAPQPIAAGAIFVPSKLHELNVADLPLSVRLEGVLQLIGVRRLGDVHGVSVHDLGRTRNCGRKTISELVRLIERAAAGEFSAAPDAAWNPSELVRTLDALVADLSDRNEEILVLRLGGRNEKVPTLEEVGAKFRLTRERVRQIVDRGVERIRKHGGARLRAQLEHAERICCEKVLPLTPALIGQWLERSHAARHFNPVFYVRLLAELKPTIPAWPAGQDASATQKGRSEEIETALEAVLRPGFQSVPLSQALALVRGYRGLGRIGAAEFLAALQHTRRFKVEFPQPDLPVVRMARRCALDTSRAVLQASDAPLTPKEILARAHPLVGPDAARWNPRTLGNALVEEKGFYLLGPRSYGLRQHFALAQEKWPQIRADFRALLERENRPISTAEVVNSRKFDWAGQTNTYELACILREDARLIDLGKFLFALTEWGIAEREYIKNLIPKVLEKAARPLTGTEVLDRLQQLRSVSPTCIASTLRKHPAIRDYSFGHYGLKTWGDSVKKNVVSDTGLVQRVIRRATRPLTFARLAEILDTPATGDLADKLWQTCVALRDILRLPDEHSPDTRLIHQSCRLERALVATAREVNRPLPLYEFQWELNERFGPLFASKSSEELRRALEQSQFFLRNADDEFILDVHLDQLGLDADAIRRACAEILSESKEIVGCEDLLERLEADGKVWENLSPDILASLLRDDDGFQEVGRDRFRVNTCKH
jgi:hypothetical protein